MKLLVITAVKAFEERTKKVLKENEVHAYSYGPVSGYRHTELKPGQGTWFGSGIDQVSSLLFLAFVTADTAQQVYAAIEESNRTCDIPSRLHIAIMPVDAYNNRTNQ